LFVNKTWKVERLRASLTPERREAILALKRHYYAEGRHEPQDIHGGYWERCKDYR
jgi:hypothetical protein